MTAMHPSEALIRDLYAARARDDLARVREILDPAIEWHEPYEYLGDLHGREAVMAALRETVAATAGTFQLELHDVLANDQHAVALVEWSAQRDGRAMHGREVAIFHVRSGRVVEAWFSAEHPDEVTEFMTQNP